MENSVETFWQDLCYSLRMLWKNPAFTAVAIITLALGIGANTALFSVVNSVLLNPLPYVQSDRLVALYSRTFDQPKFSISYPNFQDWVRENRSFSSMAAYRSQDYSLTGMGDPERVPAEMVSATFFPLLGVNPVIGRTFLPEEDRLGAAPVALIGSGLWNRKFGGARDAVGKSLTLDGVAYTIVGVIPANFHYTANNFDKGKEVYVPIGQWTDPTFRDRRAGMGMDAIGRLQPGVTFDQAKSDMESIGRHLAEEYPEADKGIGATVFPLKQDLVGDIQPLLLTLLAAVGFVLLIACVNVGNLLLARSTTRTQEFAIRCALGASRARMVRQLLTESIMLGVAGGSVGLVIASWGLQLALKVLPGAVPRVEEVHLDGHVLLFMLGASLFSGILFGLAPALKNSKGDLQETLKEGGRGASGVRHRAQRVFVVVEMALALVLLAGAGLMIRSLSKLWQVNPGFDPHNVLNFAMTLPSTLKTPEAIRAHWRSINDTLNATPGIEASALTASAMPMGGDSELPFWVDGQPKPATTGEMKISIFYLVQPDYMRVMKIPLLRGRLLSAEDKAHTHDVMVIDERFAQIHFRGQDPIGKRVNFAILNTTVEIVGVVGHVKQWGLDRDATSALQAQCYFPLEQMPDQFVSLVSRGIGVMVRTNGPPSAYEKVLRQTLSHLNSEQVMYDTRTMDEVISDSLAARRFSMELLGVFAALALVMSCVGIYGVISYIAGQRTHEIGIRMALGAERGDVLRMVVGEGAKMALVGVAIGLVAAFGLTRLLASMLFGVSAHDPLSFTGVAVLLLLVALAACYLPARRAMKVNPLTALRYE
ncbi:MAG: ABC transporter permease [Terriglobia bacterium]